MSELSLHNLRVNKKAVKKAKRVGRGNASGRGTYSSRGLKGQKSRSGGRSGLKRRGLKQFLKNKPKIGGFRSLKPKMEIVNIQDLDRLFADGELISTKKLVGKKIIDSGRYGVKILGEGKITKKLTVTADNFSESAKQAIIEAGGKAELTNKAKKSPKKLRPKK